MSWTDILGLRDGLAAAFEIDWFPYQLEALDGEQNTDPIELRACLYFATGKGKTYTALAMLYQAGVKRATVVAPPKTHAKWQYDAALIGMDIRTISHAMYRMKKTKFSKQEPMVIDEFHMLGGATGEGWKKLRTQSRFMLAPLLILSATPNYNDAERVYCVEYVLDPLGKGDYLNWLYQHCETEQSPFSKMPNVIGFRDGRPAKEHLAALPHVYYVEDPHENFPIGEINVQIPLPDAFEKYGLDVRTGRIMASQMETAAAARKLQYIDDFGVLRYEIYSELVNLAGQSIGPTLVFCARKTIAEAAHDAAIQHGARSGLVVYDANNVRALAPLAAFKDNLLDVLFGTATMSTGVDGLDKVCDLLILLDDTDDDSLRRQVIGRILPRGASTDIRKKLVARINVTT
jgi:superfamily II DNA or RNA helicase